MSVAVITVVLFGALAGGFVSGLAGFGTGLIALGIWLHVMVPGQATSLVLICSVIAQCLTFPRIWRTVRWRKVWPFVLPGLAGVPAGTWLMTVLDPSGFKLGVGVFLLLFSSFLLLVRKPVGMRVENRFADGAIGFGGGVLGGLAGLSGPLPIIWASLQGWSKEERRAVFQSFNSAVLALSLIIHAGSGLVPWNIGGLALLALPGTIIGSTAGVWAYKRLSDHHFDRAVLALLFLSGASLVLSAITV